MKPKGRIIIVSFSTFLSLLLLIGALLGQEKGSREPYRPLAVLSEVLARIQTDYVEDPNFSKVTEGALHGLLESLDSFSSYLTPEEYQEYQKKQQGEASVGIVASKRFGFATIVTLLPKGPAEVAGLQPGDIIESVDGKSTREMSLAEVVSAMEGTPGTVVRLAVVRDRATEPSPMELTRAVIPLPGVEFRMLDSGIGYLRAAALPKGQSQKIAERIRELQNKGATKFILDLRGNATGEMEEGVATANLFLQRGLISYLSGQQYPRQSFLAEAAKAVSEQEPLAVLVNSGTGGAAEIVAAAILENRRGDVVGERTYGIGSVQKLIPLDDGSALVLSIAKYFTPAGKAIQENGIIPNVAVEEEREPVPLTETEEPAPRPESPAEDAPLRRAIELLATKESLPKAA